MAILAEIRKRPGLILGSIAIALLAFLINPSSIDKLFGHNPDILGKVNGDEITRNEFNDQLSILQQQAQQQGRPTTGLEEQTWQVLVQSKLIKQQFEKMGFEMTDDYFWSQLQYDPMFSQNQQNFDEKGNFKLQEIKKQIEELQKSGNTEQYNLWLKTRKSIEYRLMARQVFSNFSAGITTSKKEANQIIKERDQNANIDYVKVDYAAYLQKNPIKVTDQDIADYVKKHPITYKTEASRNLGVVYFPATPSAADDLAVKTEIDKLYTGTDATGTTENFQNTKNDSVYISLNSDMPFNHNYLNANQLPLEIAAKVPTASVGQFFGPYKEGNYYVVSKLLGKKTSDSTLSRHILIAYKGSPAGNGVTRSKEQAKKLADSIDALVKSNPARFTEFLSYSSDPNSAAQGGNLGWTTPETPFVPEFKAYLESHPKGSTGVVETQFGYHIINIEDKKSGAMTYKVANLVKTIAPSDKTESEIDKNARRFYQQVEGKSFNEFENIAKKSNYNFTNPTSVRRFDPALQGVNSEKDADVITWAFNKDTKEGKTEFFVDEGTGSIIVAYLKGKQEAGLANPESVRPQVEPIVKNILAGKQIAEKIKKEKITSLDQVAKMFGTTKQSAQVNMLNPALGTAMEPKVAGAAFGIEKSKISNPIEGMTGVYVITKTGETFNKQPGDVNQIMQSSTQQLKGMFPQQLMRSLQENAKIKDYRIEVWNAKPEQN